LVSLQKNASDWLVGAVGVSAELEAAALAGKRFVPVPRSSEKNTLGHLLPGKLDI